MRLRCLTPQRISGADCSGKQDVRLSIALSSVSIDIWSLRRFWEINCLELGIPTIYLIPLIFHLGNYLEGHAVSGLVGWRVQNSFLRLPIHNVTFSSNLKRLQYGFLRYALFGVVVLYSVSAPVLGIAWCFTTEKKRPQKTVTTKERGKILRVQSFFRKDSSRIERERSLPKDSWCDGATVERIRKQKKETEWFLHQVKYDRKEVRRRDKNGSVILCCHPSEESYIHFSSGKRDPKLKNCWWQWWPRPQLEHMRANGPSHPHGPENRFKKE